MLGRIPKGSKTALVTGGSRGIGKALAWQLARRGYNLLLVSRDAKELVAACADIGNRFDVKTSYYELDLATPHSAHTLHDYCIDNGIQIDLLVNDAGMFIYNDVLDCTDARIEQILYLHVMTVTMLCKLFGADMARRQDGYILNLASYSKWMCYPGLSVYSASKNYVESFSRAFAMEMRESKVKVMAVSPAGVTTDLYGLPDNLKKLGRNVGILWTPNLIARTTLNALFLGRRNALVFGLTSYVPGLLNVVFLPILALLPRTICWVARKATKCLQK